MTEQEKESYDQKNYGTETFHHPACNVGEIRVVLFRVRNARSDTWRG
jgi:hypothetical protein